MLTVANAAVEFGPTLLFENITFTIGARERWGVVGRNGTGKTTLFKLLTGETTPTRGAVSRLPGVRVSLLEQHRDFGGATTVWEAVAGAFADLLALERSLADQAKRLEHDHDEAALERYGRDLERFEREGGYTYAPRVDAVLHGLGFDPDTSRVRPLTALSGGERGRVGLARQLVLPGEVLLLDEPTNHLDLETTAWLEEYLRGTDRAVVLISHDRAFLAAVADHILHFEGRTATPYDGGYEAFVQQRAERRLTQQRQFDKQQRTISAEEDYIRRNIAGQNSKQAKGRRKRLGRLPRLSAPIGEDEVMSLRLEVAERGGDQVAVLEGVTVTVPPPRASHDAPSAASESERGARSAERVLIRDFTTRILRNEVIGFVGPNGAGKSTLLRAIVGERPAARGELRLGASTSVAYYRQDLAQVPMGRTLYDVISDLRPTWERRLIQGHLGRFGFSGEEVQRRADNLSGGERARVALAMMMLSRANFLVFDEPTNHLDVESIEALEDALDEFEGTVLLVSHDRGLLRALTTKVWVLHEGRVTEFDGPFVEWEQASAERAHAASVRAAEEEGLRRMREREKLERAKREAQREAEREATRSAERVAASTPKPTPNESSRRDAERDSRRRQRDLQRQVDDAERRVAAAESRVAAISVELDDPQLYTTADGTRRAAELGKELERVKAEMERALAEWEEGTGELEAMSGRA